MNAVTVPAPITQRVIQQPQYVHADDLNVWHRLNQWRLWDYWEALNPGDDDGSSSSFTDFVKSQWDVYCASLETDEDDEPAPRVYRNRDERDADEFGVAARGEI